MSCEHVMIHRLWLLFDN